MVEPQFPKLMTYLQRIMRQSKHQISDVRLLRSKGRNGSYERTFFIILAEGPLSGAKRTKIQTEIAILKVRSLGAVVYD